MSDFNDFGFTAVNEDDMASNVDAHERLAKLYNAITPLLENLKKNPEKDYILWPNRLEKIEEFEKKLRDIVGN